MVFSKLAALLLLLAVSAFTQNASVTGAGIPGPPSLTPVYNIGTDVLCGLTNDTITGVVCPASTNAQTETSFASVVTIPANSLVPGQRLDVDLPLGYVGPATAATLNLAIRIGGAASSQAPGGTKVYSSGPWSANNQASTSSLRCSIIALTALSTTAKTMISCVNTGASGGPRNLQITNSTQLYQTFDTTISQTLVVTVTFSGTVNTGNAAILYGIFPMWSR